MKAETAVHAFEAEINQTVRDLFQTMLELDAAPTTEAMPKGQSMITAVIAFAGPWKGDLVLECGRPQALRFAQRFLQMDDLEEGSEDVTSSIAELSNIVAGNLKVVLPAGVSLGTPSLIEGVDYAVRVYGGKLINHTVYTTDAGSFSIRLIEDSNASGEKE